MSDKKLSVQVTTAIVGGLILLLMVMRTFAMYQAEKFIEEQLLPYGLQLEKLDWHFNSFSDVLVNEFHVMQPTTKGANRLSMEGTTIGFSLRKLLQSDAGFSEKFPLLEIKRIEALIVDIEALQTLRNQFSASDTSKTSTSFSLANLRINSGKLDFTQLPTEVRFTAEKSVQTPTINTTLLLFAATNKPSGQGAIEFNLDNHSFTGNLELDLPELNALITSIVSLLPESVGTQMTRVTPYIKTGKWHSVWKGNLSNWISSHEINDTHLQLNNILDEQAKEPISIKMAGNFELKKQSDRMEFGFANMYTLNVENFLTNKTADILATALSRKVTLMPKLKNALTITLPEKVTLSKNEIVFQQPIILSDDVNELTVRMQTFDFSKGAVRAHLEASTLLSLEQQTQSSLLQFDIATPLEIMQNQICVENAKAIVSTNNKFNFPIDKYSLAISNGEIKTETSGCLTENMPSLRSRFVLSLPELSVGDVALPRLEAKGEFEMEQETFSLFASPVIEGELFAARASGKIENIDFSVSSEQTQISAFNMLMAQISPQLSAHSGSAAFEINGTLLEGELTARFSSKLSDTAMTLDDFAITGLQSVIDLEVAQDFSLNTNQADFSIDVVDVGIPLEKITGSVDVRGIATAPSVVVSNTHGKLLGGEFNISPIFLPNHDKNLSTVHLNALGLSELIALTGNEDISITGKISGSVPVSFSEGYVKVSDAVLASVEPGILQIKHSQSIEAIKSQESSFSTALTLLENLHYSVLSGEGTMDEEGQINLKINVQGNNPDQEQAVDFNLNYEDNIFTRLKVLRINQSLTDSIQKQLEN